MCLFDTNLKCFYLKEIHLLGYADKACTVFNIVKSFGALKYTERQ